MQRPDELAEVVCPVCGRDLGWMDEIITGRGGDRVVGCSRCLERHNAEEWYLYGPKMKWSVEYA